MTPSVRGRTALEPHGSAGNGQNRETRELFRALSASGCLSVLQMLAAGTTDLSEIAERTGLSEREVKQHVESLSVAGVGVSDLTLVREAAGLLQAVLGSGAGNGDAPTRALHPAARVVTNPPYACTVCENAGFVSNVLGDLRMTSRQARDYHRRIQEMSSQILMAHEAERLRIARELHDDTAQEITSMLVRLRLLERSADAEEVLKNVEELRELTSGALDSVRRLAMDLRPAALDDLGLVPALQSFAERHARDWGIEVPVQVRGIKRRLPREIELVLYRVLQEALTNVAKHAEARRATVTLFRRNNQVTLVVADDGKGLDGRRTENRDTGLGVFGMRERLALVGGDLEISSQRGKGTTVTARVPLPTAGRQSRRTK